VGHLRGWTRALSQIAEIALFHPVKFKTKTGETVLFSIEQRIFIAWFDED